MENITVAKCENGHLYPSNLHKTCPYCIEEKKMIEKKNAVREVIKRSNEREFHINTKWENFELWLDKNLGGINEICNILHEALDSMSGAGPSAHNPFNGCWDKENMASYYTKK